MLERYGLLNAGSWRLSDEYKSTRHLSHLPGITFELTEEARRRTHVVYALEFDGVPRYVGETSGPLESRLLGYRYGNKSESDTDNRIKLALTKHLQEHGRVLVWYIQPATEVQLGRERVRVPISKPVEEYLIERLKPDLNVKVLKYDR